MKKLKLLLMSIFALSTITLTSCQDPTVIEMAWHEFKLEEGNVTGSAATYINTQFAALQEKYYQVNTTKEDAAKILAEFCKSLESGVSQGGYEIVGDGKYVTYSVINPTTPSQPVATSTANFAKTREPKSEEIFVLVLHSPRGSIDAIEAQISKLSFGAEITKVTNGDNISYAYKKTHSVDEDLKARVQSDARIIEHDITNMTTYENSASIFSVKVEYGYSYTNEKTQSSSTLGPNTSYMDSPSLYNHRFIQSSNATVPSEFTFSASANNLPAPYFIEYRVKQEGTTISETATREGASIKIGDVIAFYIISETEVKLTKYNGSDVDVTYTIDKR